MSLRSRLRTLLQPLVSGSRLRREHDEEIRFHLDMQAAEFERRGVAADEARRRARLALGSPSALRDDVRQAQGALWFDDARRDALFALRQLRRTPTFAFITVATLTLGIGASTAIFSVVDGVLLRPLPLPNADRIVVVWETDRRSGTTREPASWPDIVDIRQRARTLQGAEAIAGAEVNVAIGSAPPVRLTGAAVTAGYLSLTGIAPGLGRGFTAEDDRPGAAGVVLLGHAFWTRQYQGKRSALGSVIRIDDLPYTIVGVLPDGSDFAVDQVHSRAAYHAPYSGDRGIDVWTTLRASEATTPRDTHPFFLVGRMAEGRTLSQVQRELGDIATDLERAYRSNTDRGVFVESLSDVVFAPVRPVLYLLVAAVALLLLVACVNVANLLMARGATRLREVAVRGALGAGTARLGRQFVLEALLLTTLGGAAGIALAWGGLRVLVALAPRDIPRLASLGLDQRALGVAVATAVSVGLVFGMIPVAQSLRLDVVELLRGEGRAVAGGRTLRQVREGLVTLQLALSVALCICAGLLIRSFGEVLRVNPGFRAQSVVKAEYQLPDARYPRLFAPAPSSPAIWQFNMRLLAQVRSLAGVSAAALAAAHPMDAGFTNSFQIVGREAESRDFPEISVRAISADYLSTVGARLVEGRDLQASDDAAAPPVALINEAAARRFFAGGDALGHELQFWGQRRRIVGVVADERIHGLTDAAPPATYLSLAQIPMTSGVLLARVSGDPRVVGRQLEDAIRAIDPQLAVYGVEPLTETLTNSVSQRRFAMLVLAVFATATALLSLVGIFGVVNYAAAQRSREFGIRLALGATRTSVMRLVLGRGAVLAGGGAILGLAGAAAGSRLLQGLLFGVSRADPLTHVAVAAGAVGAALLAAWVPARRASGIPPAATLREE